MEAGVSAIIKIKLPTREIELTAEEAKIVMDAIKAFQLQDGLADMMTKIEDVGRRYRVEPSQPERWRPIWPPEKPPGMNPRDPFYCTDHWLTKP